MKSPTTKTTNIEATKTKSGLKRWHVVLGVAVLASITFVNWATQDYADWKALGLGGPDHKVTNWMFVSLARLAKKDPLDIGLFSDDIGQPWDVQTLKSLPAREGQRPEIGKHPIPHRQTSQFGNLDLIDQSHQLLARYAKEDSRLTFQLSHTERRSQALWLAEPENGNHHAQNDGEIAHVHPSDGSSHLILSPSDAKIVLESKWGELHPNAGTEGRLPSTTYVLVYAPRNKVELTIFEQLVVASIAYSSHK